MHSTPEAASTSFDRRALLVGSGFLAAVLTCHRRRTGAQEGTPVASPASSPVGTPIAEGQLLSINDVDLYVEQHGDAVAVPVLLLHGSLGNTEEFDNVVPVLLEAGYRTVAFDARGRGRSYWGDVPITYDQMTADAVGVLDALGIDRVHLVGWSQGGEVALSLAIHDPDRLRRVVAYGATYAPEGNRTEINVTDQMPPFEDLVADYQRLSPQPERFEELLTMELANFTEAELHSITVPVLVLDGAKEEFILPEHTKRLAELIPGAELVIMPDTGHFAPLAKPDEFNRIVLAYLAGELVGTPSAATPAA